MMDMSIPTSVNLQAPSPTPTMSVMGSMPDMSMSSTFSASTRATLWFSEWTTTSTTTYILTLLFLFSLGTLNRFLGALKSQLERKWTQHPDPTTPIYPGPPEKPTLPTTLSHIRQSSRTQPIRLQDADGLETQPLRPKLDAASIERAHHAMARRTFWVPNAPWSITRDGTSAALEFVRALIGYILMLAVMTYNVGFLFAVTGSVLLGEMVFGRYMRGGAALVADGCHE